VFGFDSTEAVPITKTSSCSYPTPTLDISAIRHRAAQYMDAITGVGDVPVTEKLPGSTGVIFTLYLPCIFGQLINSHPTNAPKQVCH
jgi:hypothetical protein